MNSFNGCGIERAILPPNLKYIGPQCFHNCKNLREIDIPKVSKWKNVSQSSMWRHEYGPFKDSFFYQNETHACRN